MQTLPDSCRSDAEGLPRRLLMGSGPSPVPERILQALAQPTIGHMDPAFLDHTDRTGSLLRSVFRTENSNTFSVSGTGSAGMETMVANFLEPGEKLLVGICGPFGERIADAAERLSIKVKRVTAPLGEPVDVTELVSHIDKDTAAVAVVHGETSTGIVQPLRGIAEGIHDVDGLLLLDCVTSLAGHPLHIDEEGVDVAFSGTQKCLNTPPGLSPFTFSPRAAERLKNRRTPVPSWCFNLLAMMKYWQSQDRLYHHTPPVNLIYALNEALTVVMEEGLSVRWNRHLRAQQALITGLETLGLRTWGNPNYRLRPLTVVSVPNGIDDAHVRRHLLDESGIEISAGLAEMKGRVWRIGTMGEGARPNAIQSVLHAFAQALGAERHTIERAVNHSSDVWSEPISVDGLDPAVTA